MGYGDRNNDRPRSGGFGGGSSGGYGEPREMHDITCADCGQKSQVPFKPDGNKPVYCKDCFRKRAPPRRF